MEMDKDLFKNCDSKGDVIAILNTLSTKNSTVTVKRLATERLLELNCVEESIQFYLLSEQQSNVQIMEQIAIAMQNASELNNSAATKMCMAAKANNNAANNMYLTVDKNNKDNIGDIILAARRKYERFNDILCENS